MHCAISLDGCADSSAPSARCGSFRRNAAGMMSVDTFPVVARERDVHNARGLRMHRSRHGPAGSVSGPASKEVT